MSDSTLKTVLDSERVRREMRERRRLPESLPGMGGVEQEMLAEMAAALGRAQAKLAGAIADLKEAYAAVDAAPLAERAAAERDAETRREAARQARWELMVQREALGLNRHEVLDDAYPFPSPPRS